MTFSESQLTEKMADCGGGGLVAKSCPTLVTERTVACQTPLSVGFFRQEYWSGFHALFHRIFPMQELKPGLLYCTEPPEKTWAIQV